MPTEIEVAALYANGWNSQQEADTFERNLVDNAPADTGLVLGYTAIGDLVQKVDALITIDPDHPCLKSLEIWAHGNPGLIDNLTAAGAATWGPQLMTLNWCDEASIYLAGCNSGLQLSSRYPASRRGPVAKSLADAMPYDANNFKVHLTVYGSNGYLRSNHTLGNESTIKSFSTTSWHAGWQIPPFWRETTNWPPYAGSQAAQGNQVWIPFKNGNW